MIRQVERNLGKLLFPRSERWKRHQKARIVLVVLALELAIAGAIVGIALLNGTKWK